MTQNNNPNSDDKYWEDVKKVCEETGLDYDSVPERTQAMIRLDNGYKINSAEPSNEELAKAFRIVGDEFMKESKTEEQDLVGKTIYLGANRLASLNEENKRLKDQSYADDGFNPPEGPCSTCGAKQTVIRPGDIRCMVCENYNFLEKENQLLTAKIEKALEALKNNLFGMKLHVENDKETGDFFFGSHIRETERTITELEK